MIVWSDLEEQPRRLYARPGAEASADDLIVERPEPPALGLQGPVAGTQAQDGPMCGAGIPAHDQGDRMNGAKLVPEAVTPRESMPDPSVHAMSQTPVSPDVASLHLLVVDDSDDIRDVLVRLVERLGHTARSASDGVEAVEALAVERFDFMLLDLTMPRMSGEDVIRWLLKHPDRGEGLRVVVVSAWAGERRAHLQELGVHAVLPKPLRFQQLRELIGERSAAPPS